MPPLLYFRRVIAAFAHFLQLFQRIGHHGQIQDIGFEIQFLDIGRIPVSIVFLPMDLGRGPVDIDDLRNGVHGRDRQVRDLRQQVFRHVRRLGYDHFRDIYVCRPKIGRDILGGCGFGFPDCPAAGRYLRHELSSHMRKIIPLKVPKGLSTSDFHTVIRQSIHRTPFRHQAGDGRPRLRRCQ